MKVNGKPIEILRLDYSSKEDDITQNSRFTAALTQSCNPVILITHGFHSGADEVWIKKMRDALLDVELQIVGTVDWKGGAHFTGFSLVDIYMEPNLYKVAASNCLVAGEWVGRVGKWLHTLIQ